MALSAIDTDTNTTSTSLTEDGTNLILTDSDSNTVSIPLADIATVNEPWFGTDDNAGATLNTEDIYTQGNVGIGIGANPITSRLTVLGNSANTVDIDGTNFFNVANFQSSPDWSGLYVGINGGNAAIGNPGNGALLFTRYLAGSGTETEAMRISSNGRVSIGGIDAPVANLHVQSDATNSNAAVLDSEIPGELEILKLRNTTPITAGTKAYISFANGGPSELGGTPWAVGSERVTTATFDQDFIVQYSNGGALLERFRIRPDGNVGIGTTNPTERLHVLSGDVKIGGSFSEGNTLFSNPTLRLHSNANNNTDGGLIEFNEDNTDFGMLIKHYTGDGVTNGDEGLSIESKFNGTLTKVMRISRYHNVGIGVISPQQKLDVAGGNIRVTGGSFIDDGVTIAAPDYVFETYFEGNSKLKEDYAFNSLSEIEAYVKENNHLPGIKSAYEIQEDGWDLSFASRFNLEKVEELFLHTIEQEKEIQTLKEENNTLKERLAKIEALLGLDEK